MTDTNEDAKGLTVAEARAVVQASGQLEGIEGPLFLADNEMEWLPYFVARYTPDAHPMAAKVIVTRAGQKPREVVISWDEYAEIIEPNPEQAERERDWNATRARKPMSVFGAEVERHAYRVVFADIVEPLIAAKRAAPAPVTVTNIVNATQADVVPDGRDWLADVDNATTPQELDVLHEEAREAGVLKLNAPLMSAFSKRLSELTAKAPPAPPATPADIVLPSAAAPSPLAVARASKPLTASAPPQRDRKRRRPQKPQAA
ncbi:hypothetical protein SK224_05380 [Microbacterium sp. BG28]|uniref:hypothetical protein n=1 Tax=Microbacterium sp. BG28 TaxID=3097356 RepID=UPI002A59E765|nr:hypothetical protein [Microbacterium sp. BG28]MDY0828556.1 hypothetical protein [Microbacterium sp. BG28]